MKKRGFSKYLLTKRYDLLDFVEPLVLLPFGFLIVRLLEFRLDLLTLMLAFVLLFVYLPALIVVFESPRRK